ncbi:MAG: Crp/Fnr family transcriptional regulator [Candidatus Acidiferrum sp.]|jgi:CRP/FNR family transcriptional regulator, cyclic AMP receptor protein
MIATNGLRILEDVSLPEGRRQRLFCNLSDTATKDLNAIEVVLRYPHHAVIHFEGQACMGIFVVCAGRVKLSATSSDGGMIIVKFARPGEVLGLPECIAGRPFGTRAAASESCTLIFIERADFLNLLNKHTDAAAQVIRELSDGYLSLIDNARENGLMPSASKKLARFLLRWCRANGDSGSSATLSLTHEEIGQAIGSARETVTRLLSVFKNKQLIRLYRSSILITDSAGLNNYARWLPHELRGTPTRQSRPSQATSQPESNR